MAKSADLRMMIAYNIYLVVQMRRTACGNLVFRSNTATAFTKHRTSPTLQPRADDQWVAESAISMLIGSQRASRDSCDSELQG